PEVAAEKGGEEVSTAVLAATLTSSVVFFPVTFLYGVSRFLFSALALAVVLSLVASYFVACSVVPLFCARFVRRHRPAQAGRYDREEGARPEAYVASGFSRTVASGFSGTVASGFSRTSGVRFSRTLGARFNAAFADRFTRLLNWYERRVRTALIGPRFVVAGITALFLISLLIYPLLGVAFFPRTDAGQFVINVKSPTGSRIEATSAGAQRVEAVGRNVVGKRDLDLVTANIGVQPGFSSIYTSNAGPHTATVQVALKEGHQVGSYDYMERTRRAVATELPHLSAY